MPSLWMSEPRERLGNQGVVGSLARGFGGLSWLAAVTADPRDAVRSRIYRSVATLYRIQGSLLGEHERVLLRHILQRLAPQVELRTRIAVATRAADDRHTPLDLVLLLVEDHIELARPLILRSPRLTDAELPKLARGWDILRRTFCAQRPDIGDAVTGV